VGEFGANQGYGFDGRGEALAAGGVGDLGGRVTPLRKGGGTEARKDRAPGEKRY
jgi:hypothetical protein